MDGIQIDRISGIVDEIVKNANFVINYRVVWIVINFVDRVGKTLFLNMILSHGRFAWGLRQGQEKLSFYIPLSVI